MAPIRTYSSIKPIKTERTHEENQERAYIAASRRSDRSLEARVESARRASEIHKRRTGRSLRVTEQDVINEEMYEEEDDDLPLQYRRLTAHLQTGSADFNRRLAAYLTHHVAMRSAFDQAINDSYAQQYPNAPSFLQSNPTGMFPSPLANPMFPPQGALPHTNPQASPISPQSSHPYRQVPYSMPGSSGFRPTAHHKRAASITSPLATPGVSQSHQNSPVEDPKDHGSRRMSMPAASAAKPDWQNAAVKVEAIPSPSAQSSPRRVSSRSGGSQQRNGEQHMAPPSTHQRYENIQQHAISPLTMTLPQDSQMLLGPALNSDDPFSSLLMGGNMHPSMNYFDFNNTHNSGKDSYYPSFEGMNATLAPSALNMSPSAQTSTDSVAGQPTGLNAGMHLSLAGIKGVEFPAAQTSLANTPTGDASWDAFINDHSWAENNT